MNRIYHIEDTVNNGKALCLHSCKVKRTARVVSAKKEFSELWFNHSRITVD